MSAFKYLPIISAPIVSDSAGAPAPFPFLSTLVGGGVNNVTGTGAVEALPHTIATEIAVGRVGTGDAATAVAAVDGAGSIGHEQQGAAALEAQVVVVASDESVERAGSGALDGLVVGVAADGAVGRTQLATTTPSLTPGPLPAIGTLLPGAYQDIAASSVELAGIGSISGGSLDLTGDGALTALGAGISADPGVVGRVGTGDAAPAAATVVGEAYRTSVQSGSASLTAGTGALEATAARGSDGSGDLSRTPGFHPVVEGAGIHAPPDGIIGVGVLQPGVATAAGAGTRQIEDMGGDVAVASVTAEVDGAFIAEWVPSTSAAGPLPHVGALLYALQAITGVGALVVLPGQASANGTAVAPPRNIAGTGALSPSLRTLAGTGAATTPGVGVFSPAAAVVSGTGARSVVGTGVLSVQPVEFLGNGNIGGEALNVVGTGDGVPAQLALLGAGTRQSEDLGGSINISPQPASVVGVGQRLTGITNATGTGVITAAVGVAAGSARRGPGGAAALAISNKLLSASALLARRGSGAVVGPAAPVLAGAGIAGGIGNEITGTAPVEPQVPVVNATVLLNVYDPMRVGTGSLEASRAVAEGTGENGFGSGATSLSANAAYVESDAARGVTGTGALMVRTGRVQTPSLYANPTDFTVDITQPTTRDETRPAI